MSATAVSIHPFNHLGRRSAQLTIAAADDSQVHVLSAKKQMPAAQEKSLNLFVPP
jgi:hypothetical protein